MRLLKALMLCAILSVGQTAVASSEPADSASVGTTSSLNINASNISVSLNSIDAGYGEIQKLYWSASPRFEYFVLNRLAVGLQTGFAGGSSISTLISAGPAVTYHFWNSTNLSTYVGGSYVYNNLTKIYGSPVTHTLGFNVGANYNFTPWFGVGPRLSYSNLVSNTNEVISVYNMPKTAKSVSLEAINLYFYF